MSYNIDPVEELQLRRAYNTLVEIQQHMQYGHPICPGALFFEDDEPIETHVEDAAKDLGAIITRIEASKYQGGV